MFINEDIRSNQSCGKNSLKSNKSVHSKVSRFSKNSRNSKKSRQSRKQQINNDPKLVNINNFTKESRSRSTKSVNRPKHLIGIQTMLEQTPLNGSNNSSLPISTHGAQINLQNQADYHISDQPQIRTLQPNDEILINDQENLPVYYASLAQINKNNQTLQDFQNNNSLAQIKQVNHNLQAVYLNHAKKQNMSFENHGGIVQPAQQRKINSGQSQKQFNMHNNQPVFQNRITPSQIEMNQRNLDMLKTNQSKRQASDSPQKRKTPSSNQNQSRVHDLNIVHQHKSEIPFNQQHFQEAIHQVNQSFQDHQQFSASAQPIESRLIANLHKVHKNARAQRANNESLGEKMNLVLNIQDESIMDLVMSQHKSNKNASVKSGKRSGNNSTSNTNKRKKSLNKKKQSSTTNQNFSNIQSSNKFNSITNQFKPTSTREQIPKFKKQQQQMKFTQFEDAAKVTAGSTINAASKGKMKVITTQNIQSIKSPNGVGTSKNAKKQQSAARNHQTQVSNLMMHNQNSSLMNITDIQINHSQFSGDEHDLVLLSSDLIKQQPSNKNKQKSKAQQQQSIIERNSVLSNSAIGEHDLKAIQTVDSAIGGWKVPKMNISQISPHKLNEFFNNNIIYSKSSKNNSISLVHMLDENDLNARHIFEQPKSTKLQTKSPNSISKKGKTGRTQSRQKGRQSRQENRLQRKSIQGQVSAGTVRRNNNTMLEHIDDNLSREDHTSQPRSKKRKSQPQTTTNQGKNSVEARQLSGERKQHHSEVNIQQKQKRITVNESIQSFKNKQLQLDIAAAEAIYLVEQRLEAQSKNQIISPQLEQQKQDMYFAVSETPDQLNLEQMKGRQILKQSLISQKNKIKETGNQITYIFNNKQELKQQEMNRIPQRHSLVGVNSKSFVKTTINSAYENDDLRSIQFSKLSCDRNLLGSQQKVKNIYTESDIKLHHRNSVQALKKSAKLNQNQSVQTVQQRNAYNTLSSRFETGQKPQNHGISMESSNSFRTQTQLQAYSAYDHNQSTKIMKLKSGRVHAVSVDRQKEPLNLYTNDLAPYSNQNTIKKLIGKGIKSKASSKSMHSRREQDMHGEIPNFNRASARSVSQTNTQPDQDTQVVFVPNKWISKNKKHQQIEVLNFIRQKSIQHPAYTDLRNSNGVNQLSLLRGQSSQDAFQRRAQSAMRNNQGRESSLSSILQNQQNFSQYELMANNFMNPRDSPNKTSTVFDGAQSSITITAKHKSPFQTTYGLVQHQKKGDKSLRQKILKGIHKQFESDQSLATTKLAAVIDKQKRAQQSQDQSKIVLNLNKQQLSEQIKTGEERRTNSILKLSRSQIDKDPLMSNQTNIPTLIDIYSDGRPVAKSTAKLSQGKLRLSSRKISVPSNGHHISGFTEIESSEAGEVDQEAINLKFEFNQEETINQQFKKENKMDNQRNYNDTPFSIASDANGMSQDGISSRLNMHPHHNSHAFDKQAYTSLQNVSNPSINHSKATTQMNIIPKPGQYPLTQLQKRALEHVSPLKQRKIIKQPNPSLTTEIQNVSQKSMRGTERSNNIHTATGASSQGTSPFIKMSSPSKSIKQKGNIQNQHQPKISQQQKTIALAYGGHSSQQKSMRNYNNYMSNNLVEESHSDNNTKSLQPIQNSQIQPKTVQHLTLVNRTQAKTLSTQTRGMALTASKEHQERQSQFMKSQAIMQKTNHKQGQQNLIKTLQAFASSPSPGSGQYSHREHASGHSSGSQKQQAYHIQQQRVFTHMCTITDPHKNTITDFCVVPNRQNFFEQTKKMFTCSLDSTIKCWNLIPVDQNNQGSIIGSPNAPNHPQNLPRFQGNHIQKVSELGYNPILDLTKPFDYDVKKPSLSYEFSEIQQHGRASKRIKVNSLVFMSHYDMLITGGTDRFISIYENQSDTLRYKCSSKIMKQAASSIVNSMCAIDGDKIIVGQSDEFIRLYQLPPSGTFAGDDSSTPLATYKFEDSGINNLCSLNDKNLFISSGFNRSISVWDTRQTQPILFFKDIHYDQITSVDKFNQEIFASASDDGYVNIWDLRMGEFIKQLKVDNNERISCIKFVNSIGSAISGNLSQSSYGSSGYTNNTTKHLLIAHADKISILSARDNFTKRQTFHMGELDANWRISKISYNEDDRLLYLSMHQLSQRSSKNAISVWNFDLSQV